jgi:hypothetical protein
MKIILTERQISKLLTEISPELKKRAAEKALADYKSSDSPSFKSKRLRQYKTFSGISDDVEITPLDNNFTEL